MAVSNLAAASLSPLSRIRRFAIDYGLALPQSSTRGIRVAGASKLDSGSARTAALTSEIDGGGVRVFTVAVALQPDENQPAHPASVAPAFARVARQLILRVR